MPSMEGFTKGGFGGFGPPYCRGAALPGDVQCLALLCVGYEQKRQNSTQKKIKNETYV
jgi:hypothetical protein